MLIELFITPLFMTIEGLISLLPVLQFPEFIMGALSGMVSILNTVNFFFPISTILFLLGSIMVFEVGMVTLYLVNWVVHRLPIVG